MKSIAAMRRSQFNALVDEEFARLQAELPTEYHKIIYMLIDRLIDEANFTGPGASRKARVDAALLLARVLQTVRQYGIWRSHESPVPPAPPQN